jgi:hypothetical protein
MQANGAFVMRKMVRRNKARVIAISARCLVLFLLFSCKLRQVLAFGKLATH